MHTSPRRDAPRNSFSTVLVFFSSFFWACRTRRLSYTHPATEPWCFSSILVTNNVEASKQASTPQASFANCFSFFFVRRSAGLLGAVDGKAGGRAAGEENARKFRQEQHVLRVVLQLLPRKACLSAGSLPRPVPSSWVHVFRRQSVAGSGGWGSRLAQRVLVRPCFLGDERQAGRYELFIELHTYISTRAKRTF